MKPRFFATPGDFRAWLLRNHQTAAELLVGFYRRKSGRPSISTDLVDARQAVQEGT